MPGNMPYRSTETFWHPLAWCAAFFLQTYSSLFPVRTGTLKWFGGDVTASVIGQQVACTRISWHSTFSFLKERKGSDIQHSWEREIDPSSTLITWPRRSCVLYFHNVVVNHCISTLWCQTRLFCSDKLRNGETSMHFDLSIGSLTTFWTNKPHPHTSTVIDCAFLYI